jgi:conjugal transfer pilus assembly protein TraB
MIKLPTEILKNKQTLLIGSIVGAFSLVIVMLSWLLFKKTDHPVDKTHHKGVMMNGSRRLSPQEVWAEKLTSEQEIQGKRLEVLEKLLETLVKNGMSSQPVVQGMQSASGQQQSPFANPSAVPFPLLTSGEGAPPQAPVEEVRNEVRQVVEGSNTNNLQGTPPPEAREPIERQKRFRSNGIQKTIVGLQNAKSRGSLKSTDNTIPAGAFARAALLGGVDASTSIQASNDPRPVLLRFLDPGTLPRRFKSDLEGCHALAATYGDISSERVFMRLEKLSCVERRTGEVIEIPVQGYIAGEDGRAGVRGIVVDRAGENMRNAMIGGFIGSMGNFLGQNQNPVTFTASGFGQASPLSGVDMLKSGAAKGASGALEKYADFYIKRAEQMQPVIQIAAGRVVDIVFTQGTAFGDSAVRGAVSKVNDQERLQHIQSIESKPQDVQTFLSQPEKHS